MSHPEVGPSRDAVHPGGEGPAQRPVGEETVEAVVRAQLSRALGGKRGMLEAAVPTLIFTVTFLSTKQLEVALGVSVAAALLLLVVRLVQRSTVQFVINALFGIGIGAFFAWRSAREAATPTTRRWPTSCRACSTTRLRGGDLADHPGPLAGGRLHGGQRRRRPDRVAPGPAGRPAVQQPELAARRALRHPVSVQLPLYLAGTSGAYDPEAAVAALGVSKIVMGWPLQIAALAAMVWLLARNHTRSTRSRANPRSPEQQQAGRWVAARVSRARRGRGAARAPPRSPPR